MEFKLYNVSHGSSSFLRTPTEKTEMIDFGGSMSWSPLLHVFGNELGGKAPLNRMVVTHHHGDHINDIFNIEDYRPKLLLRRRVEGRYAECVKKSNTDNGNKAVNEFEKIFSFYTGTADLKDTSDQAWGIEIRRYNLSIEESDDISTSDKSIVNNCSFVSIYTYGSFKLLLPGDMEKEGMRLLLQNAGFKSIVKGTKVLIAPHHGHSSGFCTELMEAIGKPIVVLASIMSGDQNVDKRYSDEKYVSGLQDGTKLMTTRKYGNLKVVVSPDGSFLINPKKI